MRVNSAILLLAMASLVACTQANQGSGPSAKVLTHLVPVVAFNTGVGSRAIIPSTLTFNDINYYLFCPALTGFASSGSGVTDGQVLASQAFLNTMMTFTAGAFTGGSNGILSGTRFTGVLSDGSGTLVVELNSAGTQLWCEEEFFIDDPSGIATSPSQGAAKYFLHQVLQGTVDPADQSIIGTSIMSFYGLTISSGTKFVAVAPKCEVYMGPWDSSTPGVTGAGLVFLKNYGTTPASQYGSAPEPSGTLDSSQLGGAIAYLKAFESASSASGSAQYALIYMSSSLTHPAQYLDGAKTFGGPGWIGGVLVNSPALAKTNLPSPSWKAKSSIDTF